MANNLYPKGYYKDQGGNVKQATIVFVVVMALGIGTMAHGGWLHQAYQGEYCSHGNKYVVNNDGTIEIDTYKKYPSNVPFQDMNSNLTGPPSGYWGADYKFDNLAHLDNIIADLKHVSDELHKVYSKDPCTNPCDDTKSFNDALNGK